MACPLLKSALVSMIWILLHALKKTCHQLIMLFSQVFDHAPEGKEISGSLLLMRQGQRQTVEYILEFCTLAAENGWNESTLKAVFRQGLNGKVLKELACRDESATLDTLIHLSILLPSLIIHMQSR